MSPPARPDQPFDLGAITAKLFETLKIGEPAPDFDVARIAGKGKGISSGWATSGARSSLIHFWMPPVRTVPGRDALALKEIQKTFGDDPRFRLISLSFARTPRRPGSHQGERPDLDARIRRHADHARASRSVTSSARSGDIPDRPGWPHPGEGPAIGRLKEAIRATISTDQRGQQ